jgi:hypothetical protein
MTETMIDLPSVIAKSDDADFLVLYREVWKFARGRGHEPLPGRAPAGAAHSGIPWSCTPTMEKSAWTDERIRRLRRSWNS